MTDNNQDVKLEEFLKAWFKEYILSAFPRPEQDDLDRAYAQADESVELHKANKINTTFAYSFNHISTMEGKGLQGYAMDKSHKKIEEFEERTDKEKEKVVSLKEALDGDYVNLHSMYEELNKKFNKAQERVKELEEILDREYDNLK